MAGHSEVCGGEETAHCVTCEREATKGVRGLLEGDSENCFWEVSNYRMAAHERLMNINLIKK